MDDRRCAARSLGFAGEGLKGDHALHTWGRGDGRFTQRGQACAQPGRLPLECPLPGPRHWSQVPAPAPGLDPWPLGSWLCLAHLVAVGTGHEPHMGHVSIGFPCLSNKSQGKLLVC